MPFRGADPSPRPPTPPPELELQSVVSCPMGVLGTKLRYFERAVHNLNWSIFLALQLCVLDDMKNGVKSPCKSPHYATKPSSEGFKGPQQRKEKGPSLFCEAHTKPGTLQETTHPGTLNIPVSILEPTVGPSGSQLWSFPLLPFTQPLGLRIPSLKSHPRGQNTFLKVQRTDSSGFMIH